MHARPAAALHVCSPRSHSATVCTTNRPPKGCGDHTQPLLRHGAEARGHLCTLARRCGCRVLLHRPGPGERLQGWARTAASDLTTIIMCIKAARPHPRQPCGRKAPAACLARRGGWEIWKTEAGAGFWRTKQGAAARLNRPAARSANSCMSPSTLTLGPSIWARPTASARSPRASWRCEGQKGAQDTLQRARARASTRRVAVDPPIAVATPS
jgi:hypothetical protein